ncbi:MAG: hypothetical protein K2L46_02555, partial [Paramuribaculum sp.]|nr:hypothetical protein [Paramuribaculum sp.]
NSVFQIRRPSSSNKLLILHLPVESAASESVIVVLKKIKRKRCGCGKKAVTLQNEIGNWALMADC